MASDPQAVEASAAWTTVLSMVAVCFFFAAPVVYGAINALLATPSRIDAVETIQDGYTVKPPRNINKDYSYFRNPMESCSDSSCLPEICDMDVADINDLLARSCNVR